MIDRAIVEEVPQVFVKFYEMFRLRAWDEEGVPSSEKLQDLGLV